MTKGLRIPGVLFLILFGVLAVRVVAPFFKPVPPLARGVTFNSKSDVDRDGRNLKFTERLRDEFPVGSPADALEARLQLEGWGQIVIDTINKRPNPWRYVQFIRPIPRGPILIGVDEITTIRWRVDDTGRIFELDGSYRQACTYCP